MYEWYEDVPTAVSSPGTAVSWPELFEAWALVEADFQQAYGIDLPQRIRSCTWRWFAVRCLGLLASPDTRVYRHFVPSE